ncbi:MAG TPA: trypsin-like peptidase domain-containing protein, partial [Pirellulales bacterium]
MLTAHLATLLLAVSSAGDITLIDFRADWCGPCRQMDPVVEQLKAAGYPVRQVNIDQDPALASQYRVASIPCFVLVADGHEIDRVVGATGGGTLIGMFRKAGYDPAARPAATANKPGRSDSGRELPAELSQTPVAGARSHASPTSYEAETGSAGASTRGASSSAPRSHASWLASCVRLKVTDPKGNSIGSGTVIDARQGEALILTCGHIFRDSDGKGEIFVDLFGDESPQHVAGRLVACDLERDVALVNIKTRAQVVAAHVAPSNYAVHEGDQVTGIGCSNGADPTVEEGRVNSLDRFRGPPNIEVSGQPVQGRSGGGLFNSQGQVIGVCNAADPTDNEGMFAAQGSIYKELDRAGLSFIYQAGLRRPNAVGEMASDARISNGGDRAIGDPPQMPQRMPPATLSLADGRTATGMKRQLTSEEAAALAELREKARDAEVICIVRPLNNPGAKSEIIVLDKAS